MCCHADEFCYHDPRKIVQLAERGGYDLVSWYSPHFYGSSGVLGAGDIVAQPASVNLV